MTAPRHRSLLITGTDTGVGKTLVSCLLVKHFRQRGLRIGVMKPVETGCPRDPTGALAPQDALRLREASGSDLNLDEICPYRFEDPLAPALAARRAGAGIDIDTIATHFLRIEAAHDLTLVEGAGGLLVPITGTVTFADLAARLGLAIVVVVGSKLGCINHCLLTVRYAERVGVNVVGYILNCTTAEQDLAQLTNAEMLAELLGPPLATIPFMPADGSAPTVIRSSMDLMLQPRPTAPPDTPA